MGYNAGEAPIEAQHITTELVIDGKLVSLPILAYQPQCCAGQCWKCGDELPAGARFCIVCGVEQPPVTGPTTRLER